MCVVVAFLPLLFMQTYRGFIVSICMCAWYGGVCEVVVNFRIELFVSIPHVKLFVPLHQTLYLKSKRHKKSTTLISLRAPNLDFELFPCS